MWKAACLCIFNLADNLGHDWLFHYPLSTELRSFSWIVVLDRCWIGAESVLNRLRSFFFNHCGIFSKVRQWRRWGWFWGVRGLLVRGQLRVFVSRLSADCKAPDGPRCVCLTR